MNLTSPAALLVLGGLVLLLAALTGAVLWTDGKPRALLQSIKSRVFFGIVGVALLGSGASLDRANVADASGPLKDEVNTLRAKIASLEAGSKDLVTRVEGTEAKQKSSEALVLDAAKRSQLASIRTVLSTFAIDPPTSNCRDIVEAPIPKTWLSKDAGACALVVNSFWPVEVVVPLVGEARILLKQSLNLLNVPVSIAEESQKGLGLGSEALGIVFPDHTPQLLVCAVRSAFVKHTNKELDAAAFTDEFVHAANSPLALNAIVVGIEFDKELDTATFRKKYRKLSSKDWETICSLPEKQFRNSVKERFADLWAIEQPTGGRNAR